MDREQRSLLVNAVKIQASEEERERLAAEAREMLPRFKKKVQSFISTCVEPEHKNEFEGEKIERVVGNVQFATNEYAMFLANNAVEATNNPKGTRIICGVPEGDEAVNVTLSMDPGDDFFDELIVISIDREEGQIEIIGDLGFMVYATERRPLAPSDLNDYSVLVERLELPDVSKTPSHYPVNRRIPVNRR